MRLSLGLAATILLTASAAFADEEVRHPFSSSVPRGSVRRIVVDIPTGEIDIRNSAGSSITVSGEVRRNYDGYRQQEKTQAMVDDISAVIRVDGEEATVERRFGPNADRWTARSFHSEFRIRIEVPRGMDVEIGTRYGEVHVEGDFGNVNVDLRAGEIHLRMPRASVHELTASVRVGEVHADLGDATISNEGIFPGKANFYNASGRSNVTLHTTAGEVHITLTR